MPTVFHCCFHSENICPLYDIERSVNNFGHLLATDERLLGEPKSVEDVLVQFPRNMARVVKRVIIRDGRIRPVKFWEKLG